MPPASAIDRAQPGRRVLARLNRGFRRAEAVEIGDRHEQRRQRARLRISCLFFDLPPTETRACREMLLSGERDHGDDRRIGRVEQCGRQRALLVLHVGTPVAGRRDDVRVVPHPLRLLTACELRQGFVAIIDAELAGVADDRARVEPIVIGECVFHPCRPCEPGAVDAAETAGASVIDRIARSTSRRKDCSRDCVHRVLAYHVTYESKFRK